MGTILSRIQKIASNEGITIGALERIIGASKGVLSRAINNGTDIQSKWLQIIVENYPQYSADWLLSGNGNMLKSPSSTSTPVDDRPKESAHHVAEGSHEGIPLIPLSAMAGAFTGNDDGVMEYECERYVIPAFKGADFLMPVKGDSMQPTYYSGDLVACQRVPLNDLFFQWNKTYVLDTSQGPLIKRIRRGSDEQHVLIVSDNPEYEPFELSKDQFHGVALVRGLVRLE